MQRKVAHTYEKMIREKQRGQLESIKQMLIDNSILVEDLFKGASAKKDGSPYDSEELAKVEMHEIVKSQDAELGIKLLIDTMKR